MPIPRKTVKRWNFRKANWLRFTHLVDNKIRRLADPALVDFDSSYTSICKVLLMAAKRTIPRGYRRQIIPTWDEECDSRYKAFPSSSHCEETTQTTTDLMQCLNMKSKQRWKDTVQSIDFTHSCRVAWKTFNRLTDRCSQPKRCPVTANSI